jgi:energy-converting hydrogenase B subunit Q
MATPHSLLLTTDNAPGTLSQITRVIAEHGVNIRSIESLGQREDGFTVYLELDQVEDLARLRAALMELAVIRRVEEPPSLMAVFGKRVIIIGGGAQVGQVAVGAISEADRHNIRGERISVDTIPLVGEEPLAGAVRAVGRLPRALSLIHKSEPTRRS